MTPRDPKTTARPQEIKKAPSHFSAEDLQKFALRQARRHPLLTEEEIKSQIAQAQGCLDWWELLRVAQSAPTEENGVRSPSLGRLPVAAQKMDEAEIQEILARGEFTLPELDEALAHSLWYGEEATWADRKAIADLLLDHGADPDGPYRDYGPLVLGTGECVQPSGLQYLIDAGANVSFPPVSTKYGMVCPMASVLGSYVRGRNARKHRMIDLLLDHGACVPPEISAPILAIHRGRADELCRLLDADPGLVTRRFPDMPYGNVELRGATLLHCAIELGEITCVEALLARHADPNAKADVISGLGGQTPIFHAINTNCDDNFFILEYLAGRKDVSIDMSVSATWRSYGEPQPIPMTPLAYAESAAQDATTIKWRKKIDEELAILLSLDRAAHA